MLLTFDDYFVSTTTRLYSMSELWCQEWLAEMEVASTAAGQPVKAVTPFTDDFLMDDAKLDDTGGKFMLFFI